MLAYEHIKSAALIIALDNGGINRHRSLSDQQRDIQQFLDRCPFPKDVLDAIDQWLGRLSKDDFQTVCIGEYTDSRHVLKSAPPSTDQLLNRIFNDVGRRLESCDR